MVEIAEITQASFEKEMAKPKATRKGQWAEVIAGVKKTGKPVQVSGLTRGQVAALARTCKDNKVEYRANYKDGVVFVGKLGKQPPKAEV